MFSGLLYEPMHSYRSPGIGLGKHWSFPTNDDGFLSWIMRVILYPVFLFTLASRKLGFMFNSRRIFPGLVLGYRPWSLGTGPGPFPLFIT